MMYNVLITGAASGIGRALALEFHAQGHTVWATARDPQKLDELKQKGIHVAKLDITSKADIDELTRMLKAQQADISLLVNNAGYGQMGPLAEMPLDKLRAQLETNVVAQVALTQALIPDMVARGDGRIVNIGSVSGILTTPFSGAYCASKAAFHCVTDALRMELAPFGIRVINVQPGGIASGFGEAASTNLPTLSENSLYQKAAQGIAARANASQTHATLAEDFAMQMVKAVTADKPDAVIRIGKGSRLLPAIDRWLPDSQSDALLSRRFGLDALKS